METITMCHGAASGAAPMIFFRLEDGEQTFYHATGIKAKPEEAEQNQNYEANWNCTSWLCARRTPLCRSSGWT